MKVLLRYTLVFLILCACDTNKNGFGIEDKRQISTWAKFEPVDGKCLLFIGQELDAIGGLEEFNDGYVDHFETPAGITMYTKIRSGDKEFGFTYTGLAGLVTTDNWGDGSSNMSLQMTSKTFENTALAIGLEMVNHEGEIARGELDSLVIALGKWIKDLGKRPVFLRIGYEFGGEWNHYHREDYKTAFKRIYHIFDTLEVRNVAYVWQSHGWGHSMDDLERWYPGDEYVDWCAYSFFSRFEEAKMIEFARLKGKPVFIAEATPSISTATTHTNGKTQPMDLANPDHANKAWSLWFEPLFHTIEQNEDIVKAVSYINANWKIRPMWKENPTFQETDARLHLSEKISEKWREKMSHTRYLKAEDGLFDILWDHGQPEIVAVKPEVDQ